MKERDSRAKDAEDIQKLNEKLEKQYANYQKQAKEI